MLLLGCAHFVVSQTSAVAKLAWESTAFEATLPAGEEKTETIFAFKNEGAAPVKIGAVRSTCGCVAGEPDKREYAPGEAGKLHVKFDAKGAVGRQDKILTVETEGKSGQVESYPLSVKVTVTEWLTISPRLLLWRKGEAATPRKVSLGVAAEAGAVVTSASSNNPVFEPLLTQESPTEWSVTIKPASTDEPSRAVVTVVLTKPDQTKLSRTLHARIQ